MLVLSKFNFFPTICFEKGMKRNMKIVLPQKQKLNTRAIVIYTISVITCVIAIIIVGLSIYYGSDELDRLITMGGSSLTQADVDYEALVSNFDNIFQNQLEEYATDASIKKVDEGQDVVYTYYKKEESKKNSYDMNLNIPYINIDNEVLAKYNKEIQQTYEKKAEEILQTENKNMIYSLQYEATIENHILSLIIRTNLKEGASAQRLMIQTFNYDLRNNKVMTLEEMINRKQLNVNDVQNRIDKKITSEHQRTEDLKSLGYEIFERNPENAMYKIENSQEFFMKDGNIYIIYAYGNENITSEMDFIIV